MRMNIKSPTTFSVTSPITNVPNPYVSSRNCPPGIRESAKQFCPVITLTTEQFFGLQLAMNQDRAYSTSCLKGMKEVKGNYCPQLTHKCIKGSANTIAGNVIPNYFCDIYEIGSASCRGKEKPIHTCIDEYEFPNVPGENPVIMKSWYEARALCKAAGKRLCGDEEWTLACEGPERKPYPYGWSRDATACNIDNPGKRDANTDGKLMRGGDIRDNELARIWNGLPSGASPRCKSDFDVYDMTGNVDEVTDNISRNGYPYKDLWKGGHWVKGARNRCRPETDGHNEYFGYYANGFRCCADTIERK